MVLIIIINISASASDQTSAFVVNYSIFGIHSFLANDENFKFSHNFKKRKNR